MNALAHMLSFLQSRPQAFKTLEHAIEWRYRVLSARVYARVCVHVCVYVCVCVCVCVCVYLRVCVPPTQYIQYVSIYSTYVYINYTTLKCGIK